MLTRREILHTSGMTAGALLLGMGIGDSADARVLRRFRDNPFSLGVASGDPLPDGVVLWTRLAPDPLAEDGSGGMPPGRFGVRYEVAEDERFAKVVKRGTVVATGELGHSVHPEVRGLKPGREYFYRFRAGPEISPVGRTKTAPAPGARISNLKFAFACCQNFEQGYFTALHHLAQEDLDLVLHIGDYIYTYDTPEGPRNIRELDAPRPSTLAGYRHRHGVYKLEAELQEAHAALPFAVTIDDHEIANNWADEHGIVEEGESREEFLRRRAVAFQAYYEHLPLRVGSAPDGPDMRLYRRLTYGDLVEFNVLDERQYRSNQVCGDGETDPRIVPACPDRLDPDRTMLGSGQERWLVDGLRSSAARWNVLAQGVQFSQFDFDLEREGEGSHYNMDAWDGYVPARRKLLDVFTQHGSLNPIVLSGDIHQAFLADIKADFDDDGSPTVGTEFVTSSVTSRGDGWARGFSRRGELLIEGNEHITYSNDRRGYVRCHLTQEQCQTDYRGVPYVSRPGAPISTLASFVIERGRPGAEAV